MGRVSTKTVGLSYSLETELNVADVIWYNLEPNDISTYGAEITRIERRTLNRDRQRLKGTVTDLNSSVEFDADLTMSSFRDFMMGFCFSKTINKDVTQIPSSEADTTADTYTVSPLTVSQASKLLIDTIVWVNGGTFPINNGLKIVAIDATSSDTTITVTDNLTSELADFKISFAGYRSAISTWGWNSGTKRATLSSTGIGIKLESLGLIPGMVIHIGSILVAGDDIVINGFENLAPNDMVGYARCFSIENDSVEFDRVDVKLQFNDTDTPTNPVDILFGEFYRNVPTNSPEFVAQSFQFELDFPNLDDGGLGKYQYAKGNFCNTFTIEIPLTDKTTISYGFIGTDTNNHVGVGERKPGADTPINPSQIQVFNTSSDIIRLRILEEDESGITTDFKSLTLTIKNNITPEKVVGILGSKFINFGDFDVDIDAQLVFTNSLVVNKIRCNETVSMDFILRNEDGTIAFDIPSMTMGGGGVEYPTNESVLINTTSMAYKDKDTNTSIGVSTIPVPLPGTELCA